jgi:hypothetical protein
MPFVLINPKWNTDEQRQKHPETLFLSNLRLFFDNIPYEDLCQDKFDEYKTRRLKLVKAGCEGLRMVDRELQTFAAACKWAVRKNLVKYNRVAIGSVFTTKRRPRRPKIELRTILRSCTISPAT